MSNPKIVYIPPEVESQWKSEGEALISRLGGKVFELYAPIPKGNLPTSDDRIFDNNEVVISSISKGTLEEDDLIARIVEESFQDNP